MMFPSAALNSASRVEYTAEYLANVAQKHTVGGNFVTMMVEPNDNTTKKVNDPYSEFHYLDGTFKEDYPAYVGAVNADKSHTVKIKEADDPENPINFSFLHADSGYGVKPLGEDDGVPIFVQEFYPLELMFYSNHPTLPGARSFIYIPQAIATRLLDNDVFSEITLNEGETYTREDYLTLLNKIVTLEIDGIDYNYAIDNIYFDNTVFVDSLQEVMGDFIFGGFNHPEGVFKPQALFFMTKYTYQNKYYLDHANYLYSTENFTYKVLDKNLKHDYSIDVSKLYLEQNVGLDVLSYVLLAISIVLLVGSVLFIVFGVFAFTIKNTLFVGGALFLPYAIYWFSYLAFGNSLFFSIFATTWQMWLIIAYIVAYFFFFLVKRSKSKVKAEV